MRKLQESSIEKEKVITAYDLLERQFPGVMVLSPEDVATALGFSRKSIYDQIAAGTFPIPVLRIGQLIKIPKLLLAEWLDGKVVAFCSELPTCTDTEQESRTEVPTKAKRGRPKNGQK